MEKTIKNYLKQTLLSLIPMSHRRMRARTPSARRLARIQTGMPQPHSTPVHGTLVRRRAPHGGYGHSHYLPRPLREARAGRQMFRIT